MTKIKTDVRLNADLARTLSGVCAQLGISRNSFHVLAITIALGMISPFLTSNSEKNPEKILDKLKGLAGWFHNTL